MKKLVTLLVFLLVSIMLVSCQSDADIASQNLSKDAEMFRINRRVVFYNGITDKYILSIEGLCSVEFLIAKFEVTCKTGPKEFKKHYLGRADNVFPFVEQLNSAPASTYHYKVIFKPSIIVPNIEFGS
jgi:hypothetical protein